MAAVGTLMPTPSRIRTGGMTGTGSSPETAVFLSLLYGGSFVFKSFSPAAEHLADFIEVT